MQQQQPQQHLTIWQHFFIDKKPTPVRRPWQWTSSLRYAGVPNTFCRRWESLSVSEIIISPKDVTLWASRFLFSP
jgi:hypothetical protein